MLVITDVRRKKVEMVRSPAPPAGLRTAP